MRKTLQWVVAMILLSLVVGFIDFNLNGFHGAPPPSGKWLVNGGLLLLMVLLIAVVAGLRKRRNNPSQKFNDSSI